MTQSKRKTPSRAATRRAVCPPPIDALLRCVETDGFVVAQLDHYPGAVDILADIAAGRIETTPYQRQNAIYALGKMNDPKAINALLPILSDPASDRRMYAIMSMSSVRNMHEQARKKLEHIAGNPKSNPNEVAYARQALGPRQVVPQQRDVQPPVRAGQASPQEPAKGSGGKQK